MCCGRNIHNRHIEGSDSMAISLKLDSDKLSVSLTSHSDSVTTLHHDKGTTGLNANTRLRCEEEGFHSLLARPGLIVLDAS